MNRLYFGGGVSGDSLKADKRVEYNKTEQSAGIAVSETFVFETAFFA